MNVEEARTKMFEAAASKRGNCAVRAVIAILRSTADR